MVQVTGTCPEEEQVTVTNDTDSKSRAAWCDCRPGSYRPEVNELGALSARCQVCPHGKYKNETGEQQCTLCADMGDPVRRETRYVPNSTISSKAFEYTLHDGLDDCGCEERYVLQHNKMRPLVLREACPSASSVDKWKDSATGETHPKLSLFRQQCCVTGTDGEPTVAPNAMPVRENAFWNNSVVVAVPREGCDPVDPRYEATMSTRQAYRCIELACREDVRLQGSNTRPRNVAAAHSLTNLDLSWVLRAVP